MTKKLWAMAMLLLLVTLTACGKKQQPDIPPGNTGSIGDTLQAAFFSFRVDAAGRTGEPAGEGRELYAVTVTVRNTGREEITVYFDDFDLYIDGEPRFAEFPSADGHLPEQSPLEPGGTLTGDLLYSIPADAKQLDFVYDEYFEGDIKGDSYRVTLD